MELLNAYFVQYSGSLRSLNRGILCYENLLHTVPEVEAEVHIKIRH